MQELWVGNEELVNMYENRLGDAGYIHFKLGRTNNRGDGMQTAYSLSESSLTLIHLLLRNSLYGSSFMKNT